MKHYYVYMYLRSRQSKSGPVGSPYYIGKGKGKRVIDKKRRCKPPSDLSKIVYFATDLTEWDAHQLEMFLIHRFGRIDNHTGCLANLTDGGEGTRGHKWSELNKIKLRTIVKTFWKTNPSAHGRIGLKHSEESKAKMSEGTKRRLALMSKEQLESKAEKCRLAALNNVEQIERMRTLFSGRKHSEATKRKMRETRLGIKYSPETIAKMRLAAKQRWVDRRLAKHP